MCTYMYIYLYMYIYGYEKYFAETNAAAAVAT